MSSRDGAHSDGSALALTIYVSVSLPYLGIIGCGGGPVSVGQVMECLEPGWWV